MQLSNTRAAFARPSPLQARLVAARRPVAATRQVRDCCPLFCPTCSASGGRFWAYLMRLE